MTPWILTGRSKTKKKTAPFTFFFLFVSGNQVNLITFSMGAASEEDFDIHNQKAIFWADSRSLEKKLFQLPDMALRIKISYMTRSGIFDYSRVILIRLYSPMVMIKKPKQLRCLYHSLSLRALQRLGVFTRLVTPLCHGIEINNLL